MAEAPTNTSQYAVSIETVRAAAERIAPYVTFTPVRPSLTL